MPLPLGDEGLGAQRHNVQAGMDGLERIVAFVVREEGGAAVVPCPFRDGGQDEEEFPDLLQGRLQGGAGGGGRGGVADATPINPGEIEIRAVVVLTAAIK